MERHHLDVLALFSGVVFVAIAIVGLTDTLVLSVADLRWLGPLAIVAFGVVLVFTSTGGRSRGTEPDAEAELGYEPDDKTQPVAQDG